MYARVATYHGADAEGLEQLLSSDRLEASLESPSEGLEGIRELLVLADPKNGRGLSITFFETEEEMRRGDAALNRTVPLSQAGGVRTGVEQYEVVLRRARS